MIIATTCMTGLAGQILGRFYIKLCIIIIIIIITSLRTT